MKTVKQMSWALAALLTISMTSGALAQSATQSRFVLDDIAEWLPGIYDNASQVYLGENFGVSADGNHQWLRLEIDAIENTGLGDAVYVMRGLYRDDENAAPSHQLLAFTVDEAMRAVRMETYRLPTGTTVTPEAGQTLGAAATRVEEECPVYWRRGSGNIYGAMPGN